MGLVAMGNRLKLTPATVTLTVTVVEVELATPITSREGAQPTVWFQAIGPSPYLLSSFTEVVRPSSFCPESALAARSTCGPSSGGSARASFWRSSSRAASNGGRESCRGSCCRSAAEISRAGPRSPLAPGDGE